MRPGIKTKDLINRLVFESAPRNEKKSTSDQNMAEVINRKNQIADFICFFFRITVISRNVQVMAESAGIIAMAVEELTLRFRLMSLNTPTIRAAKKIKESTDNTQNWTLFLLIKKYYR